MDRIACAVVPRYELALRARSDRSLWRQLVAIADLSGPGRLGAVSPAAEALGVRSGQLTAGARARCPELDILAPDPALCAAGEREVLSALDRLSPRLDSDGRGGFFLGLGGLERLHPSEAALAREVVSALGRLGLDAQVAVADQPLVAWVAARRARPVKIVRPGKDAEVLASIPLGDLGLSDRAQELCALLGLDDVGSLAALPAGELARRLGREGAELEWLLGGGRPLACPREDVAPREPERVALEIDPPVEGLEPLLFLGKSLVDRLLVRVAAARRLLVEVTLVMKLDDRSEVEHVLRPAEPTGEARPLLELLRLWLESRPLASPAASLELCASQVARPSARQLSLLRQREEKEAEALGRAVARLRAALGPACAVRPVVSDTFRPEARLSWQPFEGARGGASAGGGAVGAGEEPMMLRLLVPPEPVTWQGGRFRRAGQPAARVVAEDGPHRLSGEWWDPATRFDRTYFWLTLDDSSLVWVFRDQRDGQAYLHGVAD